MSASDEIQSELISFDEGDDDLESGQGSCEDNQSEQRSHKVIKSVEEIICDRLISAQMPTPGRKRPQDI